jgi:putative Mg2+ transporter-C (MgtC) family protein
MDTLIHDLSLWGRLLLAAGLCFLIGYERELRGQDAGDRTFALVGVGAAAFTAVGVDAFSSTDRIIQGIVAGIGFLGGGLLLQSGQKVHGLTTAAALWASASVGVLAGAGRLALASLTSVLILLLLEIQYVPGLGFLDPRDSQLARAARDADHRLADPETPMQ